MILESGIALLPPSRLDVSIQLRRLGARDVRGDHLPAEVGKAHPGLALTTDPLAAAHLELEVHGGDVAYAGEDLQPDALVLRSRSRRARNAVGVDFLEAVAVLVERVADRERAVPERRVEHVDVLVDQRLLVALEQRADFGHDFGDIGRHVDHEACPTSTSSSASRLGPSIITARVSPSL